jgi:hypothetical protein
MHSFASAACITSAARLIPISIQTDTVASLCHGSKDYRVVAAATASDSAVLVKMLTNRLYFIGRNSSCLTNVEDEIKQA